MPQAVVVVDEDKVVVWNDLLDKIELKLRYYRRLLTRPDASDVLLMTWGNKIVQLTIERSRLNHCLKRVTPETL